MTAPLSDMTPRVLLVVNLNDDEHCGKTDVPIGGSAVWRLVYRPDLGLVVVESRTTDATGADAWTNQMARGKDVGRYLWSVLATGARSLEVQP